MRIGTAAEGSRIGDLQEAVLLRKISSRMLAAGYGDSVFLLSLNFSMRHPEVIPRNEVDRMHRTDGAGRV